ncbi:MAG: hypothetical protein ACLFTB_03265 [Desulfovibrionales bacterium]
MVKPIELPVLLSQLPQIQKLQHAIQSRPEYAQTLAAQQTLEKQKESHHQVPKTEETEAKLSISPDGRQEQEQHFSRKKKRDKNDPGTESDEDTDTAGHIIDINV